MFGTFQALANIGRQRKANQALNQLLTQDPTYQQSPYAGMQLGLAQQLYGGRMAGASNLEQNIFGNQANQFGNISRNATDASQALALGGQAQGQTNQALQGLQTREQQNKYAMLQNLNQAYGGMINEGDKVMQDRIRKFGDLAQIKGQIQQNKTNALNGIFNGLNSDVGDAFKIFGMASGGGLGGLFGGGGGGGMSSGLFGNAQQQSGVNGATVGNPSWSMQQMPNMNLPVI